MSIKSCALFRASNLRLLDYPFDAALASAMEICQRAVVVVGQSEDDTDIWLRQLAAKYLGRVVIQRTEFVFNRLWQQKWWNLASSLAQSDWLFWLDADEVIDPAFAPELRELMDNPELHAVRFPFVHLFGVPHWQWTGTTVKFNTRLGRRSAGFHMRNMCNDASPTDSCVSMYMLDLRGREVEAHSYNGKAIATTAFPILHYGWCREAQAMAICQAKQRAWYANGAGLEDGHVPDVKPFDFGAGWLRRQGAREPYAGSHPAILDRWFEEHSTTWVKREQEMLA